ncbi:borealin [Elgaria multicarinata webbii]|uniref:borealin n=1 Tax=Elgaria multicarinata webbii TaxID=159646 RepID=UPI002FCD3295
MAPSRKKTTKGTNKNSLKSKKVDAFLKDFDMEAETRLEQVSEAGESLQKDISNMYNMELLRLPVALREMNWLSFIALGGSEKALEKAASMDVGILEIKKLASEAIHTPLKTVKRAKKVKKTIETIGEETGSPVPPAGKKFRQENEAAGAPEPDPEALNQRPRKAKTSAQKARTSKRSRPPSARSTHFNKRSSKANFATPVSQAAQSTTTRGVTPAATPKFDSSIFKTPGLRAPAAQERVFSISARGSPLADSNEIFITLPVGEGESIRLRASELSKRDLLCLNADTLGSVKKMSTQLLHLCSTMKSHK